MRGITSGAAYHPRMKTILITGGTGDLGHAVVPRILRDHRCIVVYRSRDAFDKLVAQIGDSDRLSGIAQDEDPGPIDGLVMLAGGFAAGGGAEDFTKMLEVNLLTAVRAVTAALPHLADGGRIVAVSSSAAVNKPAGLAAYAVAKASLVTYIQILAKELKKRRITANALAPGAMDTPGNRGSMKAEGLVPRAHVAETIAYLLSDEASEITGQLVVLDEPS